jgi:hypothetical protein
MFPKLASLSLWSIVVISVTEHVPGTWGDGRAVTFIDALGCDPRSPALVITVKREAVCVDYVRMGLLEGPVPIESDDHVLRAHRTAAFTRTAVGVAAVAPIAGQPHSFSRPVFAIVGFVIIALTAVVQLVAPRLSWLSIEESLSGTAGQRRRH